VPVQPGVPVLRGMRVLRLQGVQPALRKPCKSGFGQFIENAFDRLDLQLVLGDQFGNRGFAVDGQENIAAVTVEFDRLVLDFEHAFGSFGVDRLRVHGINTVIY
jgi:hypothetical protein